MLKLILNTARIRLKEALKKGSQQASPFFCPQGQNTWSTHADIFKAVTFFFSLPSLHQCQVQTVGVLLLPKSSQRVSVRQRPKIPSQKFLSGTCVWLGGWHPPGRVDPLAHRAERASGGIWAEGHRRVLICTLSQRAPFNLGWKLPSWEEQHLSPHRPASLWGFHPSKHLLKFTSLRAVLHNACGFLKQQSEKKSIENAKSKGDEIL